MPRWGRRDRRCGRRRRAVASLGPAVIVLAVAQGEERVDVTMVGVWRSDGLWVVRLYTVGRERERTCSLGIADSNPAAPTQGGTRVLIRSKGPSGVLLRARTTSLFCCQESRVHSLTIDATQA